LHFLVPDSRDVFDFKRSLKEGFFDFKPDNNVKTVGDFVGFYADERGRT